MMQKYIFWGALFFTVIANTHALEMSASGGREGMWVNSLQINFDKIKIAMEKLQEKYTDLKACSQSGGYLDDTDTCQPYTIGYELGEEILPGAQGTTGAYSKTIANLKTLSTTLGAGEFDLQIILPSGGTAFSYKTYPTGELPSENINDLRADWLSPSRSLGSTSDGSGWKKKTYKHSVRLRYTASTGNLDLLIYGSKKSAPKIASVKLFYDKAYLMGMSE